MGIRIQRGRVQRDEQLPQAPAPSRVLPRGQTDHGAKLLRVLTDRGSEFCGNPERHEYELYLAVEDIDHSRTKTKSPQTNGLCEPLPQDCAQRVLSSGVPQEGVPLA